ncbi:MAG: DUF2461 domain-containing protein [Actinomycetota bacterium]
MTFRGWPAEALEFFEGLEADNSRAWWVAHRDVYDRAVRGPMDELLAELAADYGPGKVFRPNRDMRFSADKSPYKTNIGAMVGEVAYVQVDVHGLGAGRGMYVMAADQLDRYRRAVDDGTTGPALEAVVGELARAGIEVTGHGSLKTAPRGYPKDHPRVALLRHKGLIAWKQWPPAAWLGTKAAKARIVGFIEAAAPLDRWLAEHVGPSTLPPDERR